MEEQDLREFDGERPKYVSYYVHEAEVARSETHSKRWMIAALIAFLALIGTNVGWIIYESTYEDVVMTQTGTADGDGSTVNLTGVGSGDLTYYGNESDADN